MASSVRQWYVGQDGCIPIGEPANSVTYHSSLNSIIVTTNEPAVKIYDVTSGSVLHKSNLSAEKGDRIHCMYLTEKNKVVFYNKTAIGVRSDLHGVLLLDTALQTPIVKGDELIHLELPLADAYQYLKAIQSAELTCTSYIDTVVKELDKQINIAHEATKGNHKTTKWATVCIEVPHTALKTVSSALVLEMRRLNVHSPGLSIASAVSDRLGYLLPSTDLEQDGNTVERTLMYSEAARRETFRKWPHMNYKWALPDPMAQAGFYHQPNVSGDDRAMCFTCNVCLVCWEPTDEPWSEHERHSPSCPFVKGEHTQNVPLSVTYATQPAFRHTGSGDRIECVSNTTCQDYVATSSKHGNIIVWNLKRNMKKYCQFILDPIGSRNSCKAESHPLCNESEEKVQDKLETSMEDSLEMKPFKGDKGVDSIDAIAAGTLYTGVDNANKDDNLQDIPLHDEKLDNDSDINFARPNENVIVTSMCIVEKKDSENESHSSKRIKGKKDSSKKVKRAINPSLICGMSMCRTKHLVHCQEDEGGGHTEETEVEKMNRMNEVVSADVSPITPPEIIASSLTGLSNTDSHYSTSCYPYILVVAVKEDVKKVSKQPSTDSLKPSTSSSNILNTMSNLSKQDWPPTLDYMYDSDPDVQIVKVTPGPQTLSASSPTEGTKLDELMEGNSSQKLSSCLDSSNTKSCPVKAGNILQRVELPPELQCENLVISHIKPTFDQQHLIVVLSHKSSENSAIQTVFTETSLSTEISDTSDINLVSSGSSFQASSKLSSDSAEQSNNDENKNCSLIQQSADLGQEMSHGCLLLYKFTYNTDNNFAFIDEKPVALRMTGPSEKGVERVLVLPQEVSNQSEEEEAVVNCDEEMFVTTPSLMSMTNSRTKNPSGLLAVIHSTGAINVVNLCDLTVLATIEPPEGDKFVDVTYCSGIDRLCLCSASSKLYFYQLSEEMPDMSDSMMEGETTPASEISELAFSKDSSKNEDIHDTSSKVSDLLAKQNLSFESLSQIHNLIQFENLMPRFTATVPPCWTEIQQEQQQRRHPQHLQHQGEATQHTRTWKLQPDNSTWDEHLFEIVLPRMCCVGHVDVKFTLNPHCASIPKVQFTLLKQNINALGKQLIPAPAATSTPVDSKINFNIEKEKDGDLTNSVEQTSVTVNNVLNPEFLERHNAEILCGPVDINDCLDLSGNSGIVSLTSPQLLMSKPRSFLLHMKGFVGIQTDQHTDKSKKKKTTSEGSDSRKSRTIKLLFDHSTSVGKTKLDNLKGCDTLTEISVTIRKTKKSNVVKERFQRYAMIELSSFHDKLLSTVSFDDGFLLTGVSADHVQNMCLDILIWITNIQMNDPDHRVHNKCILTVIQDRLKQIVQACYIQGTRTTAHKCSRLLSLCVEYSKTSADQDLAPIFSLHLLEALLDSLPFLPCAYSAGALKWFFTLLNRVKCMHVINVASKCSDLLNLVSKHFHEHASPLSALLKARYGLNGNPFECDMFDMELPQAVKQFIPGYQPSTYFGSINSSSSSNSGGTGAASQTTQTDDDYDFYDLFSNPPEKSSKSLMECARNHILGMLEVEPLHFTCHSTSDGTKMERLDNTVTLGGTTVINPAGLTASGLGNSSLSGTINFGETLPSTSSPYTHFPMPSMLPYTLQQNIAAAKHQLQELSTKNYPSVKHKIMHIKQILQEVGKNLPMSTQKTPSGSSEQMPSTPKTTPQVMTPPLTPPNEAWQQMLSQGEKFDPQKATSQPRPAMTVQTPHALLQPPAPQVLVIERIYSGARRFVILDFGKPILLTDVIIPLCGDLASLSIDVWVQGEDVDGQRLIVASDIGFRSLVMNNIMPPPVCRFLKITTIGRYGSGTTRSKIPIGAFYGHSYILPWEWNTTKSDHHPAPSTSSVASQLDFPTQSQLLSHLGSFMSLLEDIQCRYSLARTRLESLLLQTESLQYSSFLTKFYLKKNKKNDEDNSILQAYNDCLQLQLQQNLAARAIDRLQSAIGLRLPTDLHKANSDVMLKRASTDKLRFLLEHLLETVISITNSCSSIPQLPTQLYSSLDNSSCQNLFKYLCLHGNPRIQILTGMVLVRVCGSQVWFGEFLGNMLQEYFNSETMQVFSQDRVFILLTAMGQRSLQGPSAINIMESLLQMLARVLSPVLGSYGGGMIPHTGQLDLSLIGWILLFLCRNLDSSVFPNGNGEEDTASRKDQGSNLSNRWNFIQANSNVKSQMGKSRSARLYRRSLQKRLLIHKQKLMDLEHVKKNFVSSSPSTNHALLKQQEKQFKKEISQYTSKHLKDIIQIRKNDALKKLSNDDRGTEDKESLEYEPDSVLILPKQKCLPVVHGLMALLLGMDFTCNVDLFLITCKVMARVCISTRPAITLMEAMSQHQLERLIMLTTNLEFNHGNITWGGPWAGHALTCLLQDLLEGERVYPGTQFDGVTDDEMSGQMNETDDSLQNIVNLSALDTSNDTNQQSDSDSSGNQAKDDQSKLSFEKTNVQMLLDDADDYDDLPEKLHAYVTGEKNNAPPINPTTNVMYVQPTPTSNMNGALTYITGDMDDQLPKPSQTGYKGIKAVFGSTSYHQKPPPVPTIDPKQSNNTTVSQGLSTALDARLESGLETRAELKLRMMLFSQSDTLQGAFTSQLPVSSVDGQSQGNPRVSPTFDDIGDSMSGMPEVTSYEMLSRAYDDLFGQLPLQRVNMDSLLQLWLTLNEENVLDSSSHRQPFDPSRIPIIPLSVISIKNLLATVASTPALPIRTWVMVFQCLTLTSNLKVSGEEPGMERSMVVAMIGDPNLVGVVTKFLSGASTGSPASSSESQCQVGPSAVQVFYLFLQRLHICMCGEDNIHRLKEIMLKLVYSLTAERGAFQSGLGPLDAQCKFLDFILELTYDQVDIYNAISVTESISSLVHQHIVCQERVTCKSTSDVAINCRSCFGGLFSSLLRGNESSSRTRDVTRDQLMCSLLKVVNGLLHVQFPLSRPGRNTTSTMDSFHGQEHHGSGNTSRSEPLTDSSKLSHAMASSSPHSSRSRSDEEKVAQTDEQKTETANLERYDTENQGTVLADIILSRRTIMYNFILALSYCNSSTMAMILGSTGMPSNMQDSFTNGHPLSVGDGIYQILITLSKKCNNNRLLMDSLFMYLSGGFLSNTTVSLCRLSEPILWFILKVLDSSAMLKLFLEKGGVEVVCRNFVNCNSRIISTTSSLISTIMQNMNGKGQADKKKYETDSTDGLQNFAPLGTISSSSPTASPAEVLIVAAQHHRRARSAPWSYHFYPDEAWVDLKIVLPFAILLKEVQLQPHSPALSTCPSFVSLEASQDGVTSFPLCSPMNTNSLVFIKLQLQKPEVVTMVTVRLHKARDSMTIGLSQILLMGYSAFGESGYKTNNLFLPTEDIVSRSSVGWIRLLHHCLTSQRDMESVVAEAASPTPSLLNTCTALLVSPISTMYAPTIETVLLKLGLHSGAMGLALIDNLLRNALHSDTGFNSQYLGKVSGIANDSTVEILYQLGTVQDRWTSERVQAMLQWLGDSARVALQRKAVFSDDGGYRQMPHRISQMTLPGPAPSHVHCVAAVLWRSGEISLDYCLSQLITKDLVSSLYEWSSVLEIDCHLKKAVDYTLCAICHICPDAFGRIMEWMGIVISPDYGLTSSITDDRKDNSQYHTMTDDSKEAINALGQQADILDNSPAVILQELKHMCIDEAHLSTLALTCKSELATRQLLESGFPAVLAQGLFEFCNRVVSTFADSWSQPEGITDSCKSMSSNTGENNSTSTSSAGICITADMVAAVLNFFSEVSSRAAMKDWLGGADGNIFWPVLLTMLCNTPLHSPISVSALPQKYELVSVEERAAIESASVNFFCNIIACHIPNQMLFSKVLFDVIKEQGATGKVGLGVCPLSGFTRRLFLQVLLEDDKILVSFRAPQQYRIQIPSLANQIQHPHFGAGRRFKTMFVNMHMTIAELTNKVSDTPSIAAQLLDVQNDKKAEKDSSQIGLEIVENICAANTIEAETTDKGNSPVADSSKLSVPPRPPTRRGRHTAGPLVKQLNVPTLSLYHKLISNQCLPMDMTLSQLLQVLQNHGLPQGHCVIDFILQLGLKDNGNKDLSDDVNEVPDEVLLTSTPYPTALQVFASVGGLALLAEHLPLLYPEISRQITTPDSTSETQSGPLGDTSQDWVQIDSYPEELYELYEPMSPAPPTNPAHNMCNPSIPPHSLIAFGLFLRLPGYAEVLLKERKKAQCLLRLVLGVTDDGEGGHILTSPISNSLPTLPFIVLKSLFDTTPLTTDDGVLLRRMCLEIGALHLILACMSVLSHHAPRSNVSGFQQDAQSILSAIQTPVSTTSHSTPYVTEEKSQQYWAKGTGFGTGSTTSSWDAEQALIRQKSEEEHVTCLLQVLASYINPGGCMPEDYDSDEYEPKSERTLLPEVVPEMLSHSCLVPALSSYLRNDSVLDMARHVPLYRSLLLLLRAISTCPPLVMLLLPLEKEGNQDSATGVGELLDKMRGCVDTYASRLKSNKTKTSGTKEEEEENEGLAMLIPDIQETARIVQKATERVEKPEGSNDSTDTCSELKETLKESFDEVYLSEMKKLQFSQYEMVTEEGTQIKFAIKHHYEHSVKTAGDIKNPNRIRRLAQEAVTLSTSLPLSVSSSVFVRCDEERLDIMKVLITGPEDTPYANGCFEFDVYFPQDYPNAPPHINLETTGNQSVRFNPNLYNDGKVCLSVLNTWHGRPEEKWSPQTSSFLQVLVSIQSLILVCEPYFNEPGYERSRGTPSGTASSREYDSNIRQATVKWAILEQLKTPSPSFKDVIHKHFWLKRHRILKQCEEWIGEMETYSNDKRTGRTIAHSTLALKKHYNQLREEFAKFKPPEGLEDYGSGDIDPKEKHYQTDAASASAPQVFPPDNNANSLLSKDDDLKQVMTNADC